MTKLERREAKVVDTVLQLRHECDTWLTRQLSTTPRPWDEPLFDAIDDFCDATIALRKAQHRKSKTK